MSRRKRTSRLRRLNGRRRWTSERGEWNACLALSPRLLLAAASGYLLGTVPSADIAARLATGGDVDLRSSGSRNPGGVNAIRLLGNTPGRAVIVADVGEGICRVRLRSPRRRRSRRARRGRRRGRRALLPGLERFAGGKGVATSFGQCLYTFPAFAPLQMATAVAATRIPGVQQRALVSAGAASAAWLAASVLWWKRGLSNSWGPPPTAALPLATAATVLIVGSAFARALRRRDPDDLASSG